MAITFHNMEKRSRAGESTDDNIIHEHFSLRMKCYKYTLTEYEIVVAFILQQCLQECASMLGYSTSTVWFKGCIQSQSLKLDFTISSLYKKKLQYICELIHKFNNKKGHFWRSRMFVSTFGC